MMWSSIRFMTIWTAGAVTAAAMIVLFNGWPQENKNACRAANPGYDCTLGWVRGEAFK